MSDTFVLESLNNRVLTLTMNNPDKRNALGQPLVQALTQALHKAEANTDVKVIILTGAGPAFCAGADLASLQAMQQNSYEENLADSQLLRNLFDTMYAHPKVIIGAINGHAIAGGCGLAALCDLSYAVPEAQLGYTEVRIGFIPALVSLYLTRKIGDGKARELLLTGDLITAESAVIKGLINGVFTANELLDHCQQLGERMAKQNSGQSMAATKALLADATDLTLSEGLNLAAERNAIARASKDCQRGIAAFLSKEKLSW